VLPKKKKRKKILAIGHYKSAGLSNTYK
jgi:hypothetical protein